MAVTLMRIAQAANVSHTTVSRVLNGKGMDFISRATREKVLKAALDLGYQPYRRRAPDSPAKVFALWIPEVAGIYAEFQVQLNRKLAKRGHELVSLSTDNPELLRGLHLDGVFALDMVPFVRAFLADDRPNLVPILCLGNQGLPELDALVFDLADAARRATAHLFSLGCRRVAMALPARYNTHGPERRDGYLEAVGEAGREAELIETPSYEPDAVRAAVRRHVEEHGLPDGLFCFSDQLAMGAMCGLRDTGARIPEDTRVIGLDGLMAGPYLNPSLSTMTLDVDRVCEQARRWMLERVLRPDTAPRRKAFPYELVERGSTGRGARFDSV